MAILASCGIWVTRQDNRAEKCCHGGSAYSTQWCVTDPVAF